ncbi:Fatty acyl-CoA reductase 1 [Eumeta japonica]|uniref:Fatty acyl-CoA reductase n=1 Tax=Eumeta variegata TaxID=151549 RepID=A0A4C1WMQ1_EUMVA|nr:Fatty acyl-CoA reductase 1 [Eumeta japonica]
MSSVNEWYRGRKILVTGATGFMGKVLIEKILYSIPDVECVYALVRSKRGKTPEARIEEMWKLPMFARIREEKPHVMKKLIMIEGDVMYENLGVEQLLLEQLLEEHLPRKSGLPEVELHSSTKLIEVFTKGVNENTIRYRRSSCGSIPIIAAAASAEGRR